MAESGGSIGEQESVGRRLKSLSFLPSASPATVNLKPPAISHTNTSRTSLPLRLSHSCFLTTHGCQTEKCREIWTCKYRLFSYTQCLRKRTVKTFLLSLRELSKCQEAEDRTLREMKCTHRNLSAWNHFEKFSLWSMLLKTCCLLNVFLYVSEEKLKLTRMSNLTHVEKPL